MHSTSAAHQFETIAAWIGLGLVAWCTFAALIAVAIAPALRTRRRQQTREMPLMTSAAQLWLLADDDEAGS
jgi:hypothetical protein